MMGYCRLRLGWVIVSCFCLWGATTAGATLPARVVNHEHLPVVGNQQDNEVCMLFHAIYYGLTYIKAKEHGWIHPDPAVNPERVMAWEFGQLTVNHLDKFGCATYADIASGWEESVWSPAASGFGWPKREQWEAALKNRIWGREQITVSSAEKLEELKGRLAGGEIGLTSLMSTQSFQDYGQSGSSLAGVDNDVFYSYAGQNGAGHAVTFIGYDDNKSYVNAEGQTRQGAFLAVNSWGTGWGVVAPEVGSRGFIWIAYDFVLGSQWTAEFYINRPEETPKALAVVEWEHPLSHQVHLELKAGRPQDAQWSLNFSLNFFDRPVKTRMVLDVTEPWEQGWRDFWLRSYTADFVTLEDPAQGTINYFAIEAPGAAEPWACVEAPARIVPLGSTSDPNFLWLRAGLLEDEGAVDASFKLVGSRQIWGDFDGDGRDEGLVHGYENRDGDFVYPSYMMLPDGEGGIRLNPAGLVQADLTLTSGDLDNDGRLDVLSWPREGGQLQAWRYSSFAQAFTAMDLALPEVNLGWGGVMELIDFNLDGRLDLATLEGLGNENDPTSLRIWLRQADGSFVDSGIRPDLRQDDRLYPGMAWSDFDGDGWPDLVLTARAEFYSDYYDEYYYSESLVWLRNLEGTGFEEYAHGEYGDAPKGNMAFGDANNDGRPDLALANTNIVYLNHGAGQLERIELGLDFYDACRIEWVDIDNDGWMDLITTGDRGTVRDYYTTLWRNNGDGTFSSAIGTLPGLWLGSLGVVDLDEDGDVDLVGGGWIEDVACWPEREPSLRIFRNRTAQAAGFARSNEPPVRPSGVQAAIEGSRLTLSWDPAQDDHTPSEAMRYHLRLESFPGWNDHVSGVSGADCIANRSTGRLNGEHGALVTGLPDRPLYASVQAVDGSGARSGWSEPLRVAADGAYDPCDVNRDGQVDVADLVSCQLLEAGQSAPDGSNGDINQDSIVSSLDRRYVFNRLLDRDMPGRDVVAMVEVGPAGGQVVLDDFVLQISPDQFAEKTLLTVHRMEHERPEGEDSVSPLFRIEGLPEGGLTDFTVRLRRDREVVEAPLLAYGLDGWRTSGGFPTRGSCYYAPSTVEGDWYEYRIAHSPGTATLNAGLAGGPSLAAASDYEWSNVDGWFGLASGKAIVTSTHFHVVFPVDHDYVAISQLVDALEDAWTKLKDELLFSYTALPSPIQVEVLDRGPNEYGSFLNLPGTAFDKLEFNTKDIVRDNATIGVTAWHEFSHCVHAQFFSSFSSTYYWLDEASAVWAETVAAPTKLPPVYDENSAAAMNGLFAGAKSNAEKHGYGMANLFRYLQSVNTVQPMTVTSKMWHSIRSGSSPAQAILGVHGSLDFEWYTYFLEQHVLGRLFAYNHVDIDRDAPDARTLDLAKSDLDHAASFSGEIPDLGGRLFQTKVNRTGLPADAQLSHRLRSGSDVDLSGFQYMVGETTQYEGRGSMANGAIKIDVPIGEWTVDTNGRRRALALLTNREGSAMKNYVGKTDYTLDLAVTWDREYPLPVCEAVNAQVYGGIPRFSVTGMLEGPGLTDFNTLVLDNINGRGDSVGVFIMASLMGVPPLELVLDFDATAILTEATESEGVTTRHYSCGPITYQMQYYTDAAFQNRMTMTSLDGRFTIPIDSSLEFFSCTVQTVYDITETVTVDNQPPSVILHEYQTTNVGGLYLSF